MSGVEVRPLSRLPGRIPPDGPRRTVRPAPPYTSRAMQITTTPGSQVHVQLEIELPAERLDRAIDDAVRRLSRRTRVPGFRPGKAPRPVLERAPRARASSSTRPSSTSSRTPTARPSSSRTSCR